jgi:hypothetical protein
MKAAMQFEGERGLAWDLEKYKTQKVFQFQNSTEVLVRQCTHWQRVAAALSLQCDGVRSAPPPLVRRQIEKNDTKCEDSREDWRVCVL